METKTTSHGMSLIEFMAFIGLMSIIFMWLIPDANSVAFGNSLEKQSQKLADFLQQMNVKAGYTGRDIQVVLRKTDYQAQFTDTKQGINLKILPKQVSIETTSQIRLSFYKSGVCTPATVRIRDARRVCVLRLALRGRVTRTCSRL